MFDNTADAFTLVATCIGFLVLAWVALCVLGSMIFSVLVFFDFIAGWRKHKSARHETSGRPMDLPDHVKFFQKMNDEDRDQDWRRQYDFPDTDDITALDPHIIETRRKISEQRAKLGYTGSIPVVKSETERAYDDVTAIFEPIDPEMTMVGELPAFEALDSTDYPFNQGDSKNEAARDRPA